MIQFNLLPDVKLEYLKARMQRRLVIGISAVAIVASSVLVLSVLSVSGLQKKHLQDLNTDITTASNSLQKKTDVNKILTVQNQLQSIGALHAAKPSTTRLFDYLNQVTPVQADIISLASDFGLHTLTINGNSDALSSVNQYIDTLKFTNYTTSDSKATKKRAFGNVVLSSFSLPTASNTGASGTKKATYSITLLYDPAIFDVTKTVKLDVPSQVTTRSEVEEPKELFTAPAPVGVPGAAPVTATPPATPAAGGSR